MNGEIMRIFIPKIAQWLGGRDDLCSVYTRCLLSDIGIPNGPAEDSTRGLLKAHKMKNMKFRKPN
jgi:hypothetical protein